MQLIMLVAVGTPDYVRDHRHTICEARSSVWVDGALVTAASEEQTASAVGRIEQNCREVGLTLKPEPRAPVRELDFIGVTWQLEHGTWRVADKTFNKIPQDVPETMTAGEIERLVGRLIFCSAISQRALVNFYFSMKLAKRICHQLNTAQMTPSTEIKLADGFRTGLQAWVKDVTFHRRPRFVDQRANANAWLFTDSTLDSWGAILALSDGRVFVHGAGFNDGKAEPIHVREAEAVVLSLGYFSEILGSLARSRALSELHCYVDNTTVENNIRRGTVGVDKMQPCIQQALDAALKLNISIAMHRIGSNENPSDEPSRLREYDPAKLRRALEIGRDDATKRLGGSAARIFATPNAFVSSDKHLRLTTEKSQRRAVEVDNNE
jgi:hypothetical protein